MHAVVRPAIACLLLVGVGLAAAVLATVSCSANPGLIRAAVPVAAAAHASGDAVAAVPVLAAAPKTSPPV
jgi:hypothetical protein